MKKKFICLILASVIAVMTCGCGYFSDYAQYREEYEEFQEYKKYKASLEESQQAIPGTTVEETVTETVTQEPTTETEADTSIVPDTSTGEKVDITTLTPEEIEARKALQMLYIAERNQVYTWPASYEKTVKINELDKKILENAYYSFQDKNIVFIGDSVTQGVGGNVGPDGKMISYVNYVNEVLDFNTVWNHGKGGSTVADYGDSSSSMQKNIDTLIHVDADIVVVLIGGNDYMAYSTTKRFGTIDSGSTAGYCGALQYFMETAKKNNPDKDYFFVTLYQLLGADGSVYTDYEGAPTFNDYMEVQRTLAPRYGFNVIDIYTTGFMSTVDPFTTANFIPDGVHPNDAGYRMLGEHIAAELLIYYEMQMEAQ